ncbi:MerR family transcriptional regulator, partial [Streptomyces goshikiensis]
RRRRLGALLAEPPGATGPVSPALAALLAQAPRTDSPSAAKDRDYLTLLDATGTGNEEMLGLLGTLVGDPAVVELYERLDALAEAPTDDPRIAPLAADLMAAVPEELFAAIPQDGVVVTGFKEALLAEYAPAQAEVVGRLMDGFMDAFMERGRG